MKFLSINGKLYKSMIVLWDAVKLNFMWILFSLPIITIGASTAALFHVTLKMVDNTEGNVVKQFIEGFKLSWKQGIIMGMITMIAVYSTYLNFELFNKIDGNPIIFLLAGIFIAFFGLLHLTYAFPLIARYKNTIWNTLGNAKEVTFKYFFRTIGLWMLIALLCFAFVWNITLMFVGLLIAPVSICLVISAFANKSFNEIEKDRLAG